MTYEDFEKFVQERCMYETIYDDSDGRPILVIRLLDAYGMVNKAAAADTAKALRARLVQPEQEIELDRDHVEDDGCPTEKAVLQRFWREHQKQEPVATLFGSLPVYDVPPKQEPVAWVENLENARPHCVTDLKYCSVAQHERGEHLKYIPLYTAPPQQHSEQWWRHEVSNAYANGYEKGRASVKQPEQEPVAWIYSHKGQKSVSMNYVAGVRAIPLYNSPPQREWQGLTDEEIDETAWPYFIGNIMPSVKLIVRQLEAKLKEKNHG